MNWIFLLIFRENILEKDWIGNQFKFLNWSDLASWIDVSSDIYLWTSARPDWLIHGMKQFETESVLLAGSLYQLAGAEDDGPDPVTALHLLRLVEEQQPGLQDAPQLGPALEWSSNLEPVSQDYDAVIVECGEKLLRHALLLHPVASLLSLVTFFPI